METALGIETWGHRGKSSKLQIITEISSNTGSRNLDIDRLTIADLNRILKVSRNNQTLKTSVPKSRAKKPYLEPLTKLFPTVKNLEKLTVSSLGALLGAFIDDK